ncbi:MAG: hypothetical protein GEV12_16465, partial [Micromonosporaceae bacterium]|nr:hypothetical protein [Micromonosporaceae bacterium]
MAGHDRSGRDGVPPAATRSARPTRTGAAPAWWGDGAGDGPAARRGRAPQERTPPGRTPPPPPQERTPPGRTPRGPEVRLADQFVRRPLRTGRPPAPAGPPPAASRNPLPHPPPPNAPPPRLRTSAAPATAPPASPPVPLRPPPAPPPGNGSPPPPRGNPLTTTGSGRRTAPRAPAAGRPDGAGPGVDPRLHGRRSRRWYGVFAGVAALVVLLTCAGFSYQLVQDELAGRNAQADIGEPSATVPRDISSREVDPEPLTVDEVFPNEE